jgi:hypothetical protein
MTDAQIQEIYALARESFFGGQTAFQLEAFPFRMTALNMAKHRNNPNFAFWKMLKEGYDHFEATKQEPKVAVCEKRYVFNPAQSENASKPLKFDAKGKCPAYELDKNIADAVTEKRRSEQSQMAEYIGRNISTVAMRQGVDGGMNPVFATKLASHEEFDNNGRVYQVAGNSQAPGALPRTPIANSATVDTPPQPQAQPDISETVQMAKVRMPTPAPRAKEGEAPTEQPTTIAGLIGNMFGGAKAEAKPEAPVAEESQPAALRGSKTEVAAAKPKKAATFQTASAPVPQPAPREAAPAKPAQVATNTPEAAPKPRVIPIEKKETPQPAERDMRTAFSAPPAAPSGLLSGAQPVVPAGTFDSRFSGLR